MKDLLIFQVVAILLYSSLWFLFAHRLRRYDLADVAWGLGFFYLTAIGQVAASNASVRSTLLLALVFIWGARLSFYIFWRNRGNEEDPRYRKWRRDWGAHASVRAYFQLFLFQGILIVIIVCPVTYVLAHSEQGFQWLDLFGVFIWMVGFLVETVGDHQKYRFKKNPANHGRILSSGLWKYSRHPNYFGEVVLWWGVWLIACSVPGGWITVLGPATITVLILYVSGIPLLEKRYEGNKEYEAYRKRTSAFLPLRPKK